MSDPGRVGTVGEFARALTLLRERAGLTVRQLQKPTGIVPSTLGGYFSGRHRPSVEALEKILTACGVTDPAERAAWVEALLRVRRAPRPRDPAPCPYRGLAGFGTDDAAWFFGRERLVDAAVAAVLECAAAGRPLVVVGPSGAGKSSLLRAGLVPALAERHGMNAVVLTPGREPRAEVERALAGAPGREHVLVVDQLEEVFAPDVADAEAAAVAAALAASAAEPGGPAVVLGLRADFYARALRVPELAAALQAGQLVVGPMTADELRAAVTGPAVRADLEVDDDLAGLLLHDLHDGALPAGGLPLLSHALLATWERSDRRRLTVADYRASGGVTGAVARTAEQVLAELGPDDGLDAPVRRLFLRLVHVAPGAADTRRRVDRGELLDRPDAAAAGAVLDAFVRHRLLVVGADAAGRPTVEVAHEALLEAWPRLRRWLDADRVGIIAHRQLVDAAATWRAHGEDPDLLLRGAPLAAAADRFGPRERRGELNDLERRFLAAGEEQAARRAAQQQRQTRRLRRLLAAVTALLLVAVGLGAYAVGQRGDLVRERDAAVSRQLAMRSAALRPEDPALAAQLAVAAYRTAPTREARSGLLDATAVPVPARLVGPPAVSQAVAVGGGLLASSTASGPTVGLWRAGPDGRFAPAGETPPAPGPVQAVALGVDGRVLAAGGADGTVTVRDPGDPAAPPATASTGAAVVALALTPDGRTLLAGGPDGAVRRWDVAPGALVERPPLPGPGGEVLALAVSADGRLAAAGRADGRTHLWPLAGGDPVEVPGGGKVHAVAFAPDGRTLAVGGGDRTVHLWDLADPARPRAGPLLGGPTNWVNALAFAPDGRTLAAGSSDGKAYVFDTATGRTVAQLPHPAPVTSAAFLDGRRLVTGEADGVAHVWPLPGPVVGGFGDAVFALDFDRGGDVLAVGPGRRDGSVHLLGPGGRPLGPPVANPPGEPAVSGSAALSPDGRTLAVGRVDGSVRLWDVADPARPVPLGAPLAASTALVEQLAFSADGRLLAVSADDAAVRLWDVSAPPAPRLLATLDGPSSYVFASAFSPDGRLLAAASADTRTYLWDLADPAAPRRLATLDGPTSYAYSPAFSPDGRYLAVGSADKTVRLWDVRDPARPVAVGEPLVGPANYVYAVAWSPDGRTLAAGSTDGTVRLWDAADPAGAVPLATLTGPAEAVFGVAWSPDGSRVVAGSGDRTVRAWTADPAAASAQLCAAAGTPLGEAEWAREVPGLPYDPPCR